MCGRFTLTSPLEALSKLFGFKDRPNIAMSYNIAPTHDVATIRPGNEGRRHFASISWGLIPSWIKDNNTSQRLINARGETVAIKPSFSDAFCSRRCLIAADGFYEWKTNASGLVKQPYRITLADDDLFAFAGIWESWPIPSPSMPGSSALDTCAIITTTAANQISHIHSRMPVILEEEDYETWLTGTPEQARALIHPYEGVLKAYKVSTRVNAVKNNDLDLLAQIEELDDDSTLKSDMTDDSQHNLF